MKKKLNVDLIQSELRGGSAFFPGYTGGASPATSEEPEPAGAKETTPRQSMPVNQQENRKGVPPVVPLVPKVKRPIRQRQPFDIYQDQYEQLKQIADAERDFVNGRGMSQMVREAIDNYLRDHASSKK
jgi:hypothetical protein